MRKVILLGLCAVLSQFSINKCYSHEGVKGMIRHALPMNSEVKVVNPRVLIENVFKDVVENMHADEEVISQYFSPHYIQYVDGHILNYNEFVQHMRVQKTLLRSIKISLERYVESNNQICTVHRVDAVKKNGDTLTSKVIAYFEIENGKITFCDELTHLIKGKEEDQKIGSIK